MPSTSKRSTCSTGSPVTSSPRSTAAAGARAIRALSTNPTCSGNSGPAPVGAAVAAQQVGQLGGARPALEPIDGAFDFAQALRRQRHARELAKLLANFGLVVRIQAISPRAVAGARD